MIQTALFGGKMKYNSSKKQAFNNWKKKDRTPAWAKINKRTRVYDARYYEVMKDLQSTLNFVDGVKLDKSDLEHLGHYILKLRDEKKIQGNYIKKEYDTVYMQQLFYRSYYDKTGYGEYWELEEINYSRLAEKLLGITEKNKLKCLGGNRWIIWKKK